MSARDEMAEKIVRVFNDYDNCSDPIMPLKYRLADLVLQQQAEAVREVVSPIDSRKTWENPPEAISKALSIAEKYIGGGK